MTPTTAVIALAPIFGTLCIGVGWMVKVMTRVENRLTRVETMIEYPHLIKVQAEKKIGAMAAEAVK